MRLYEATLERLEAERLPLRAGAAPLLRARARDRLRVLFTTSNGTGLGHLTRSMAIARRLGDEVEPLFLTLSAAAPVVEQMGLPVEYVASYATPVSGNDYRWSRRLRARLRAVIAEAEPDAVVFDGTHPYEALLGALPAGASAVWCRRPLWQAGLEPGAARPRRRLRRGARARRAGRVGGPRADGGAARPRPPRRADRPPRPRRAARPRARRGRARARAGRTNVLVTPRPGQRRSARRPRAACAGLAGRDDVRSRRSPRRWRRSARSPTEWSSCAATYPMSRYFAAFDAAVAAAGYNAFHELIALGVPSLFVPMARETDDQPARARWAAGAGLGLAVEGPADAALEAPSIACSTDSERGPIADPPRRRSHPPTAPPKRPVARPTSPPAPTCAGRRRPHPAGTPRERGSARLSPPLGAPSSPAPPQTASGSPASS